MGIFFLFLEGHKVAPMAHTNPFTYTASRKGVHTRLFNLLSPEPVFQVSGSKMTCPKQMTTTSLLKGLYE